MTRNTARHLRIEDLTKRRRENAKDDLPVAGEHLVARESPNGMIFRVDGKGDEIPWPDHPLSQSLEDELRIFLCGPEPTVIRSREFTQRVLDEAPSVGWVELFGSSKRYGSQIRIKFADED